MKAMAKHPSANSAFRFVFMSRNVPRRTGGAKITLRRRAHHRKDVAGQRVATWNAWRHENPTPPDLRGAALREVYLRRRTSARGSSRLARAKREICGAYATVMANSEKCPAYAGFFPVEAFPEICYKIAEICYKIVNDG
jgi:hypothetical protein